jgi:hypothetical protein
MEKLQVFDVLECNKTLYKMIEQKNTLPISVGLKLNKIIKEFDEVEEYVFSLMDMTFKDFDWEKMTKEQLMFYEKLVSEKIELDFDKIPTSFFENNDKLMLTIEDIKRLEIILC